MHAPTLSGFCISIPKFNNKDTCTYTARAVCVGLHESGYAGGASARAREDVPEADEGPRALCVLLPRGAGPLRAIRRPRNLYGKPIKQRAVPIHFIGLKLYLVRAFMMVYSSNNLVY